MRVKLIFFVGCFLLCFFAKAQQARIDSISRILEKTADKDAKGGLLIFRSRATTVISVDKARADAQQALACYQETNNVEGQIDAYLQLSGLYSRESKYQLALDLDNITYNLAKKISYKKGMAIALSNVGRNEQQVGNMKKAKQALLASNELYKEAGLERETAEIKNRLGVLYRKIGEYKNSLKSFDEGLDVANRYKLNIALANIYMNKANTLDESGSYDEAIANHLLSVKIKDKLNDERGLAQSYNNLGNVYTHAGQYQEALHYFRLTRNLAEKQRPQNKTTLALAYNNLANGLNAVNEYDSVLTLYNKSLDLFTDTKEKPGIALVYHDMGNFYLEQKNYKSAITYLNKALEYRSGSLLVTDEASTRNLIGVALGKMNRHKEAEQQLLKSLSMVKDGNTRLQEGIYKALATHYTTVGDPEKANDYQSRYFNLKDTLLTSSESMNMLKEKNSYDLEKKEALLKIAEQQRQVSKLSLSNRNKTIAILAIGIGLLTLLTIFFAHNMQQKKKTAAAMSKKNEKIETLIKELHHRVKNNLQVVSGLLALQSNRLEDEHAKQAMDAGRSRVDAMALIHQKLYLGNDLASIDIKSYLENLSASLALSYGYAGSSINTQVRLAKNEMDVDKAIPIGLIVNELVTNSFKHAFSDFDRASVSVQLTEVNTGELELEIADNGNGAISKEDHQHSFGMKLVNTLVEQLNGSLQRLEKNGTAYLIKINNAA